MNIYEIIKLSLSNLFINKFRSFLTMLGIIMGIASVILISSIGNGFRNKLFEDVSSDMDNFIFINVESRDKLKRNEYLNDVDIKQIKQLPNIDNVRTAYQYNGYDNDTASNYQITAMNPDDFKLWGIKLLQGRYFTKKELDDRYSNKILIDHLAAQRIFPNQSALGKYVSVILGNKKEKYQIVGVFKNYQEYISKLAGFNNTLYMLPKKVLASRSENRYYPFLIASVKNNKKIASSVQDITNLLNRKTNKQNIYKVRSFTQEIEKFNKIFDKISLMISLIAGIALIVGGIGVMNIMLVSVNERITEIGLRKALGAKNRDIKNQFLIEASVLTFIGGMIGIIIGYSLAWLVSIPLGLIPIITPNVLIVSMAISILTGLFFGSYPAKKASKLTPMEALRKE